MTADRLVITEATADLAAGPRVEPFARREGCTVEPLIEAAEMFPALERMALAAKRQLWLAFRIFDPDTPLYSDEAKALGLADWGSLFGHLADRGVEVRLMLADFEPVMADYLHAMSWRSFNRLRALHRERGGRVQVLVVQHVGEIGIVWRQLLRLPLRGKTRRVVEKLLGEDAAAFADRPGLWRNVGWDDGRPVRWKPSGPPRLWPATFHHKFAVADGCVAIVGGIDVNERRYDDADHDQRADRTWHDISSRITGTAAHDAAVHYAALWNVERARATEIAGYWSEGAPEALALGELSEAVPPPPASTPANGPAGVQLLRTRSRRNASPFAIGPHPHVRELRAAHHMLFSGARERLYIEAQFFRSKQAARWLADALRANPRLEAIILVANVPEEVAFQGQGGNPAHRHGEYLQARALRRIVKAGGLDRVGLFSLARDARARGKERDFADDRGTAFGAGLIHIHAKLVIADDDAVLLSSANINGRSFEWDTELGLLWTGNTRDIRAFRTRLWSQLSDGALDASATVADWRALALGNTTSDPADRRGFVIPYQIGRARRFGRPAWFVPDDLV